MHNQYDACGIITACNCNRKPTLLGILQFYYCLLQFIWRCFVPRTKKWNSVVSFATWDRLTCSQTRWSLMYSNNKVSRSLAMPPHIPFLGQKKMARQGRRYLWSPQNKDSFHLNPTPWSGSYWETKTDEESRNLQCTIFTKKEAAVLLCTYIAAWGLDFPAVHWIVQLDCPKDASTIHKVGRTARCEEECNALLFLLPCRGSGILEASIVHALQKRESLGSTLHTHWGQSLLTNSTVSSILTSFHARHSGQSPYRNAAQPLNPQRSPHLLQTH